MSRRRHTNAQVCLNTLLDRHEANPERSLKLYEHISNEFPSLEVEDAFRDTLRASEQLGAVRLHSGKGSAAHLMVKVELVDPDPLYIFLSRSPRGDRVSGAEAELMNRLDGFSIPAAGTQLVTSLLSAWEVGKNYHRIGIDDLDAAVGFVKAFSATVARPDGDGRDLRTYSRQTCGDSKLIEGHKSRIIAEARAQAFLPPDIPDEEIDGYLGLEKFPHLAQVAGALPLVEQLSSKRRHVGIHPDEIPDLEVLPFKALVTIENYASFNRHVREAMGPSEIVIYTGGWPGRAERDLIRHLAPHARSIHHWGDIDAAGAGIADAVWRISDRAIELHLMSPKIARTHGVPSQQPVSITVLAASPARPLLDWLASGDAHILEQEELDPQRIDLSDRTFNTMPTS